MASKPLYPTLLTLLILLAPTPGLAQNRTQGFWDDIWQRIIRSRDQEKPRTSRGLICPVIPQMLEREALLWRNRPTFVWKGEAASIAVYKTSLKGLPIWQKAVKKGEQQTTYDGPQLLPGVSYVWQAQGLGGLTSVGFQILGQSDGLRPFAERLDQRTVGHRQSISLALTQVEARLRLHKASPDEQIQQRADFFLNQGLFLDAASELFVSGTSSEDVKHYQQAFIQKSCPSGKVDDRKELPIKINGAQ
jgi:hypothetical protein